MAIVTAALGDAKVLRLGPGGAGSADTELFFLRSRRSLAPIFLGSCPDGLRPVQHHGCAASSALIRKI